MIEQLTQLVTSGAISLHKYILRNTSPLAASGNVYGLEIETDTEAQDTGAGVAITNHGHSDGMYVNVLGKPSGETAPTGIGMDVNKHNNPSFRGYGLQIWDWGRGLAGATALYLRKQLDPNNLGRLLVLRANRGALSFEVPEGEGYDPGAPLVDIHTVGGAGKMAITAGGSVVFGPQGAVVFILDWAGMRLGYLANRGGALAIGFGDGGELRSEAGALVYAGPNGTITRLAEA
jgi:hypothetical protein